MIKVDKDTKLTVGNVAAWIKEWQKDYNRIADNFAMYENRKDGKPVVKLPFAKKLVITSVSAAVGDGITLTAGELDAAEQRTYDRLMDLFKQQTPLLHDRKIVKDGCITGRGYELVYFSSDLEPIPKMAQLDPRNTFVVFDDTVEHNSLYGMSFVASKDDKQQDIYKVTVYDSVNIYKADIAVDSKIKDVRELTVDRPHNIGRMPITEYHNNQEEQGDFEQVIDLIKDRTILHNLSIQDSLAVAKNYLLAKGVKIAGKTSEEKDKSQAEMANSQRIELLGGEKSDGTYEDYTDKTVEILSKAESYSSITQFGADIDQKIYSLSLVPDVADEAFAGNQSGVAIEHKYMPLKQLCAEKDEEIEKLYRRRLKMFIYALSQKDFAPIDLSKIDIKIVRVWSKVETEIAQTIATLKATGLPFSDKSLMEMFPAIEYDSEIGQVENEYTDKPAPQEDNALLQRYLEALKPEAVSNDNSEE